VRNTFMIVVRKSQGWRSLWGLGRCWEDKIKMDLKGVGREIVG